MLWEIEIKVLIIWYYMEYYDMLCYEILTITLSHIEEFQAFSCEIKNKNYSKIRCKATSGPSNSVKSKVRSLCKKRFSKINKKCNWKKIECFLVQLNKIELVLRTIQERLNKKSKLVQERFKQLSIFKYDLF